MKLGFIGARNMAKAMIGGILKNNIFNLSNLNFIKRNNNHNIAIFSKFIFFI